jgi:plastocyanin
METTEGRILVRAIAPAAALVIFIGAVHSFQAEGGSVSGTVSGWSDFAETPAVVYIGEIAGREFEPSTGIAVIDQRGIRFVPHVLAVQVGTVVEFPNNDTVLHNVFAPSPTGDLFHLGTYPSGVTRSHRFDEPGEVVLLCNVHPEMEAYILVVATPFMAVTDEKGAFTITGVPPGTHTLRVWHPRLKGEAKEIVIREGASITIEFSLR